MFNGRIVFDGRRIGGLDATQVRLLTGRESQQTQPPDTQCLAAAEATREQVQGIVNDRQHGQGLGVAIP